MIQFHRLMDFPFHAPLTFCPQDFTPNNYNNIVLIKCLTPTFYSRNSPQNICPTHFCSVDLHSFLFKKYFWYRIISLFESLVMFREKESWFVCMASSSSISWIWRFDFHYTLKWKRNLQQQCPVSWLTGAHFPHTAAFLCCD